MERGLNGLSRSSGAAAMSEKTAVIHQPDFMPYLGFFQRLLQCDLFIVLDHVQFSKGGWHNRDKIKTPQGAKWITIPVHIKGKPNINQVLLKQDTDWREEHLKKIKRCYAGTEAFDRIYNELCEVYELQCDRMVDFNMHVLEWLFNKFDIIVPIVFSSSLNPNGRSNDMLVDVLKKAGAVTYLSGIGARDYFREEPFEQAGIKVLWQHFEHPVYPQLHGEFIPYLSGIDLLLNCGTQRSRKILRSCL